MTHGDASGPAPDGRWLRSVVGDGHPALAPPDEIVVGVLPGEGVGPALTRAAAAVLDAVGAVHDLPLRVLDGPAGPPAAHEEELTRFVAGVHARGGAVLAGAVSGRFVYDLRRELDLFCKLVPVSPWGALVPSSPFRPEHLLGVDLMIVRENAAGVYQGRGRRVAAGDDVRVEHEFAYAASEVERIVRVAASIAARRRGELAVVVKDGGLPELSALWREAAADACEPLGIRPSFVDVDLCAYQLVQAPAALDVVVAPNLFGDVLADLSALLLGGRGLSYSGNFAPSGAAVYQTNHGAAFDLAASDTANPVGQICALAMLLRESAAAGDAARTIERAVESVWRAGWRTRDVAAAGDRVVGTSELTDRIVDAIHAASLAADPARAA